MTYFDNINFINLEWVFAQIYKVVINIPQYILYALFFWSDAITSFWLKFVFWLLSVLVTAVIFYSIYKIWELNEIEGEKYLAIFSSRAMEESEKNVVRQEWIDILGHMESSNPTNWVMAVIEADKILDTLLAERGYDGASIGDKLKSIEEGKLRSLSDAWEAHKIRNKIAHETGFVLEAREAKKAIAHYEAVFRELGYLE